MTFVGHITWTQLVGQRTVMVKVQQLELPDLSTAQQVTVVLPTGKLKVAGGVQVTESSWQLSEADGAGYCTLIGLQFGLVTTMLLGQVMLGGWVSVRTVTSKQHHCGAEPATVFVQQTMVAPIGKTLPEGREQVNGKVFPVQVSMA